MESSLTPGATLVRDLIPRPKSPRRVAQASIEDVDRAVASARRAYEKVWSKTPGAERAKYLYRIARLIRNALASWRSSRRSTTASRSGVARHRHSSGLGPLLLLRRVGRQARLRRLRPHAPSARRRRSDHSVEFSAAHGGVEDRAGVRGGKYHRPQACRDDAAHGARTGGDSSAGRIAPGVVNIVTGDGVSRRRARRASRHRQDRVHRFDRGRQAHPTARRGCHTNT